jgi:hypothetical protein
VRWPFFWFLWAWTAGFLSASAQVNVVQDFSGRGPSTTGLFKVQDRWEVRWNSRQAVSVAVMSQNGTIVAGASGVLRGSLFLPLGGQYYLKISDGTVAPTDGTNGAPPSGNSSPFGTPVPSTTSDAGTPFGTPEPAPTGGGSASPPDQKEAWHIQVVELGKAAAPAQELSVYTPWFIIPDAAAAPSPNIPPPSVPPPDAGPPVLTNEEALTIVTVKGDNTEGSGFLMRSPDGTFVVTQLHLLAANPNVKICTKSGAPITIISLKGAVDRDLALFTIKDDHYTYLPLATDASGGVQTGDQVIIPDIGQTTDDLVGRPGRLIGMATDRIDFDNNISPGGNGAPVIHVKSGKVLALVTSAGPIDISQTVAKSWTASPPPGAGGNSYYGLPLYGVRGWENFDWARFQAETLLLKQFHEDTRGLDSFLNGQRRRDRGAGNANGPPDSRYFMSNPKIRSASDTFKQAADDTDQSQQLDAAKELLFDLQGVADGGVSTLQGQNFYSFDQTWARKELAYRKVLKNELDDMSNNINRLEEIAWSR